MKIVEPIEVKFKPRIGWDRDLRGTCQDGMWGEFIPSKWPEGAVVAHGGFETSETIRAVKDGRVVATACSGCCTWWDDPVAEVAALPEEGETLVITFEGYNPCRGWTGSSEELREIGAWRDADAKLREEKAEEKARKRAAYEYVVSECNRLYGRYAEVLLRHHLGGGWSLEDGVAIAALELIRAPKVVEFLWGRKVPGGLKVLRAIERKFLPVDGEDLLMESLRGLTGPRMCRAIQVAACCLGL